MVAFNTPSKISNLPMETFNIPSNLSNPFQALQSPFSPQELARFPHKTLLAKMSEIGNRMREKWSE
jgi:hypothetical protein